MENVNLLPAPACQSHLIKVEFNLHGDVIDSLFLNESNDKSEVLHILPNGYREIVTSIRNNRRVHYNMKSVYLERYWQWSFHFQEGNVCAYAIDITDAVHKEKLLSKHRAIMDSLRLQESTLSFRRLTHDFRSPVSAMISGLGILESALSIEDLSDEKILIDEMSKECQRLYDHIGIKLNRQYIEQLKSTINKSLVDINTLLIASEEYSVQLSEYFDISYQFIQTKELPQLYCDLEKLSVSVYQMLLFLAQEYTNSTVRIIGGYYENKIQLEFNIQGIAVKRRHQEFIDHYLENSHDVEIILDKDLYEICELVSLNQGEIRIENHYGINSNESCWLFTFELN